MTIELYVILRGLQERKMRKLIIILLLLNAYNLTYSSSLYSNYKERMLGVIYDSLGKQNGIQIDMFPIIQSDYDSEKEQFRSGTSNDVRLFLRLSSMMIDSIQWGESFSVNDIERISKWWDKNYHIITPEFAEDIIWYKNTLNRLEFFLNDDEWDKLHQRLLSRIQFREKKELFCGEVVDMDKNYFDKSDINSQQKILQEIFNSDKALINSIVPYIDTKFYVFISKKLMSANEYKILTPVSRYEFEDMMDWWFVNGCAVSDSIIRSTIDEYNEWLYDN